MTKNQKWAIGIGAGVVGVGALAAYIYSNRKTRAPQRMELVSPTQKVVVLDANKRPVGVASVPVAKAETSPVAFLNKPSPTNTITFIPASANTGTTSQVNYPPQLVGYGYGYNLGFHRTMPEVFDSLDHLSGCGCGSCS